MSITDPFWDKAARKYNASKIGNMPAYERTLDHTRAYLTPDDSVLEIGCGTASTALLLAPLVADYTASDISAEMVAIGCEKARAAGIDHLRNLHATLGDPQIGPGPYDAVLGFNLLHLMPDVEGAARQVHALLKPGGMFISKTACLSGWRGLLRVPIAGMRLFGKAPWVTFMSTEVLESHIRAAGFEIVESFDPSGSPMGHFVAARRL
ncbi:class I SAM-dependent methyltransferase [Pararhodobacter oceanensis]|uniref:class I SAM-dependent methyltransferase n=1 Tax=Pararhodobacter oceanensis TaxID=2172121 RepID=UPI003A8CF0B5